MFLEIDNRCWKYQESGSHTRYVKEGQGIMSVYICKNSEDEIFKDR